jgi:hypothetical protein
MIYTNSHTQSILVPTRTDSVYVSRVYMYVCMSVRRVYNYWVEPITTSKTFGPAPNFHIKETSVLNTYCAINVCWSCETEYAGIYTCRYYIIQPQALSTGYSQQIGVLCTSLGARPFTRFILTLGTVKLYRSQMTLWIVSEKQQQRRE